MTDILERLRAAARLAEATNTIATLTAERDALREALSASKGYMMNALLDLQTGTPKETTSGLLRRGIDKVDAALLAARKD